MQAGPVVEQRSNAIVGLGEDFLKLLATNRDKASLDVFWLG